MATKTTLDKDGLQKLLDSVSASLNQVLEKAEKPESEPLAKASPGEEAPSEKTPPTDSKEESSSADSGSEGSDKGGDSSGGDDKSAPPAAAAPDASASAAPAEGTAPAPEGQAPAGDPAQDQGGSVESLQAEYAALPIEELKMHMLACKAALMSQMAQGGDQGAAPDAGMPGPAGATPPMPDASASAAPAPGPGQEATPPITKSEDSALLDRIAALEASNQTLAKSLADKDKVIEGFGSIATKLTEKITGQRKSVATMASIQKPGTELVKSESTEINLSYDQIKVKLNDVTANTRLSKSDRDAVIAFVAGNTKDVSKIAHLLK